MQVKKEKKVVVATTKKLFVKPKTILTKPKSTAAVQKLVETKKAEPEKAIEKKNETKTEVVKK